MCQVSMSTMNVLIACRDLKYNGVLFYNDNLPVVIFQYKYVHVTALHVVKTY